MLLTGRGAEQQSKGADTVARVHQPDARARQGRQAEQRLRLPDRPGQRPGRARARPEGRPAARLPPDRRSRATARRSRACGASTPAALPGKGKSAVRAARRARPRGRHPRAARVRLERRGRVAQRAQHRRASSPRSTCWSSATRSRTRPPPPRTSSCPSTQWAEEEGTMTNLEGRVILRQRVQPPPRRRARPTSRSSRELAERLGDGARLPLRRRRSRVRRAAPGHRRRAAPTTAASPTTRSAPSDGVFWPCPSADHPGTPRLFAERFAIPDGRARFHAVPPPPGGRAARRRLPALLHDRPLQGALQLGRADAARGRAARRPAGAAACRSTRGWPPRLGVADGGSLLVESRRGEVDLRRSRSAPTSARTRCSRRSTGAASSAANMLTIPALDPISRMPEFKLCAVRAAVAAGRA